MQPPHAYRAPLPRLPLTWSRLLTAVFVVAISVPLVATIAGVGGEGTGEENRAPAPWPGWPRDVAAATAWPEAMTRAFTDHVAFRGALVRAQARFRVQVLGTSPSPDVVLGRDGWLFYGTDGAVEDHTGTSPFTTTELEVWRTTLQHTHDWLAARGIAYVFVIAPDKHAIYPELLPVNLPRVGTRSRAGQLAEYMRTHGTVTVVDLADAVRQAKPSGRLYHRTDTHWNDLGAHAGYAQTLSALPEALGIGPHGRDRFRVTSEDAPGLDLARILGLGQVLREEVIRLEPLTPRTARIVEPADPSPDLMDARVVTETPAGPRAVVFRDSFASAMIPFLAEHFGRAVFAWQDEFDPALVEVERPQVVIQQWVARHLYTRAPYDAVAARAEIGRP